MKDSIRIAIMIILSGCKTNEPAQLRTAKDGYIVNREYGFNGYSIKFPEGYRKFDLGDPEIESSWAADIEANNQVYLASRTYPVITSDVIVNGNKMIIVSAERTTLQKPLSQMRANEKNMVLRNSAANWEVYGDASMQNSSVQKIGDKDVARISSSHDDGYTEYYIALGGLREIYTFWGFTTDDDPSVLKADIETMILSIEN
ncbi:hypothetical protein [Rubellicoccus peritrichatus]|uniref:Uncharacterized protein n=1 Tax=Rubellicoccus peritrichatus TaxID=3080537 RepID=A0AAQ3QX10_9BACT|nr:hypothetical protein [Puniceicoccus sp. CR14]WOO42512.1 hypothetical protein RZN69_05375 [Puniceicoccus sp. CR14]